jgi:hypothetical protein
MTTEFKGREVEYEIDVYHGEATITNAWWLDTLVLLTDAEMDQMQHDCAEDIDFEVLQHQIMRAENAYEGDR